MDRYGEYLMWETALLKAIQQFDSMQQFSEKLGVPRENVSAWLHKNVQIPLLYALRIEGLTQGKISWKTLVLPHVVRLLQSIFISIGPTMSCPGVQVDVSLHRVQAPQKPILALKKPLPTSEVSLGLDENNQIIFGEELFYHYQALGKKTIPAWRFSLPDFLAGQCKPEALVQMLSLSERISLGMALEMFIGNRQGQRANRLKNKDKADFNAVLWERFPEVKEKRTLALIAYLIGFGNNHRKSFEQGKQVLQYGCPELIQQLNQRKIALSTAASLASLCHTKQEQILARSKKEIITFVKILKKRSSKKNIRN